MPVGIVMASIVGVITVIWLIQRSRAEPKVEFRQDTMRYIAIDPDRKTRNHQPQVKTPPTSELRDANNSAMETVPEPAVSGNEAPEIDVAPKPVYVDESRDESEVVVSETTVELEDPFVSPELLLNDK